jgi:hypothetical protein
MGSIEYTFGDGATGAQDCSLHGRHGANDNAQRQGPGIAKVRTENLRIIEGNALASVLDGKPWSRRRLADVLGIGETIVRGWCAGTRKIQSERLKEACPVVWARWQARLAEVSRKESAA